MNDDEYDDNLKSMMSVRKTPEYGGESNVVGKVGIVTQASLILHGITVRSGIRS